jgi:valyl-tRNA synthetase
MEAPTEGGPWRQEEDVLDTWFSSWLWPFSIMGWPNETKELEFFYPTADLVTGPDIIFFWVARMIMAGYEFKGELPFKNVYFTSIIRDQQGRKLSKSLGNSPDPLTVIDEYGADALRFSIIYIAPVGMDICYSNESCEIGRNFANKLWNACRFRQMQGDVTEGFKDLSSITFKNLTPDEKWIISWVHEATLSVNRALENFRFHTATHELYELVWNNFCDWYLELAKVRIFSDDPAIKQQALAVTDFVLYKILRLLHPFMPFVTEDLAHQMGFLSEGETIMFEPYPEDMKLKGIPAILETDPDLLDLVEGKLQLIRAGRRLRVSYEIPPAQKLSYYIKAVDEKTATYLKSETDCLKRLLNAEKIDVCTKDFDASSGHAPSILVNAGNIYLPLDGVIDIEVELGKLNKQKQQILGWIKGSEAKLSNERFLSKAPENVVADAKSHLEELQQKLKRTELIIDSLK